MVHSEKDLVSRKLDEGRMAHPPLGCPVRSRPIPVGSKLFPQMSDTGHGERPLPNYRNDEMLGSGLVFKPKSALQQ